MVRPAVRPDEEPIRKRLKELSEKRRRFGYARLDALDEKAQQREVENSLKFLKEIYGSLKKWAMCYPYGVYNDSLLSILRDKKCMVGLSTTVGIANLDSDDPLTLPRLDAKDLPLKGL